MEKPILFNSEMVRAILDGRKTQTRRIIKPQPWYGGAIPGGPHYKWPPGGERFNDGADMQRMTQQCPHGKPGDRLWVRETWGWFTPNWDGIEWVPDRPYREVREMNFGDVLIDGNLIWRADGGFVWSKEDSSEECSAWKPSIHMPRWASRINL